VHKKLESVVNNQASMITIVKLNEQRQEKIRYQGEILERTPEQVVVQAYWTNPGLDLGYTHFDLGDRFIEYYYTRRWFNIFDIADKNGFRKGWYCNVAEPASIYADHIEQVDLLLDVWVDTKGRIQVLDEDEFKKAHMLSAEQRRGAQEGLQALLKLVEECQEAFSSLR
jgi:hypothetical protein